MYRIMAPHPVMRLLSSGIPLTLVMDLAAADGPDSFVVLLTEPAPELAWWEPAADT